MLAKLVRQRQVSSVQLVTAHIEQIEKLQPRINAVVWLMAEKALDAAREIESKLASGIDCGPLAGVPFSVKDSIAVAGERCTAGTLGRRNAPAELEDATLVQRLRSAGGIPLARTNLPDLLFSFETNNLL